MIYDGVYCATPFSRSGVLCPANSDSARPVDVELRKETDKHEGDIDEME